MRKKKLKKIIFLGATVFVAGYVAAQVYSIKCPKIKTETAVCTTISDSIDTMAYVFRDEEEIKSSGDNGGVLNFILNDGDIVEKNGIIAEVYSSEDDELAYKNIELIDSEIKKLNNLCLSGVNISTTPSAIEKQISRDHSLLLSNLSDGNYTNVFKSKDQLLYLLNTRQIVIGKENNFFQRINELSAKKDNLIASHKPSIGNILSHASGYFSGNIDGLEGAFNYKNARSLDIESLENLLKKEKSEIQSNSMGKVVKSYNWYIACKIPSDYVSRVTIDDYVTVSLPFASAAALDAKIVAVNQKEKNSDAVLILQCDQMNSDLINIRKEFIKVNIKEHSGIMINKKALHEKVLKKTIKNDNGDSEKIEKNVYGVYVLSGKQLIFKEVSILYSGSNYVICDKNPSEEKLLSNLSPQVYDEIVVEGTDLYDKKIIKG